MTETFGLCEGGLTVDFGATSKVSLLGGIRNGDDAPVVIMQIDEAQVIEQDGKLVQIVPFDPDSAKRFGMAVIESAILAGASDEGDENDN